MVNTQEDEQHVSVDLQPIGRRALVTPAMSLLDAAQSTGVEIAAVCGGAGSCGKCRVQRIEGDLTPPTADERRFFNEDELAAGYRLACQAYPRSDVKINIPPESLSTPQRLQVEGQETEIAPDPVIETVDITLTPPTLDDLRADTVRLTDALKEGGTQRPFFGQPVLRVLSEQLRSHDWSVRLALRHQRAGNGQPHSEVVGVLRRDQPVVGLAVDIGTTKMAAYLVDLKTGHTLAKDGLMNPQIAYGEDVVSRIAYTNEHPDGRDVLQRRLIAGLNDLVTKLCATAGIDREQIAEAVVVGNTAIHHLFTGLPVAQLGASPYIAAVSEPLDIRADHLGLTLAPGAKVYLPPNIAGYVGADHVSMLLATEAWQAEAPTIALDIGTNTEISLAANGKLLSCSCASGPAFEGAHIHAGMRAAPGAVEYVQITPDGGDGEIRVQTIGNRPAVGICGSGILDIVAELRQAGIVSRNGRMTKDHPRFVDREGGGAFLLVDEAHTGNGHDLLVTRRDVNEIQLAKGAIRAGVDVLLNEAGIRYDDLGAFIVAGAFGTYLDLKSATRIGMFPPLPLNRFQQVGNAAGTGARQMLISVARRRIAETIVDRVRYIELTAHPSFTDLYMSAMVL
jgi:uncharacterized 2Fe-2S/4Fe-4S cluster protein (DUF4445 family)